MPRKKKPDAPSAKPDDGSKYMASSVAEVADFFGVHRETVQREWSRKWPKDCKIGSGRWSKYDLSRIAKWVAKLGQARYESQDSEGAELNKRIKLLDLANREEDLKAKQRTSQEASGVLVDREAAERETKAALRALRDSILKTPTKMIPLWGESGPYIADQFRRQLEAACHECVDRLNLNGHSKSPIT